MIVARTKRFQYGGVVSSIAHSPAPVECRVVLASENGAERFCQSMFLLQTSHLQSHIVHDRLIQDQVIERQDGDGAQHAALFWQIHYEWTPRLVRVVSDFDEKIEQILSTGELVATDKVSVELLVREITRADDSSKRELEIVEVEESRGIGHARLFLEFSLYAMIRDSLQPLQSGDSYAGNSH